jgi:hypothetical protein
MDMTEDTFDLYALDGELAVEELPPGNALGCWFSASSSSTASCPGGTIASIGSASTFG